MNWITKFIKPKIKSLFEKKSSKIEENLWTTCSCKNLIYKEDMDANQMVCPKCGEHHKLTCKERFKTFFDKKEFELLELLARNPGKVFNRFEIEEKVWPEYTGGSNVVDVYIGYLRRKLEGEAERRLIHTVRGVGYVLREE